MVDSMAYNHTMNSKQPIPPQAIADELHRRAARIVDRVVAEAMELVRAAKPVEIRRQIVVMRDKLAANASRLPD